MTLKEFSNEFDVLANSYAVNVFGLTGTASEFNEYEKSVFLTRALEQVIRGLYNGKIGLDSFEKTEELRRYLNSLVKTDVLDLVSSLDYIVEDSIMYKLPEDLLFITYEAALISLGERCGSYCAEVVPTTLDDLHKTKSNPFRGPNSNRVLRLDMGKVEGIEHIEVVSKYPIEEYRIRYVSKPYPIILSNLDGLTIDNQEEPKELLLDSLIHRTILELAVLLALQSRSNTKTSQ